MRVIGRKSYDVENNGVRYKGVTLHCTEPASGNAEGDLTMTLSIGSTKPGYACPVFFSRMDV